MLSTPLLLIGIILMGMITLILRAFPTIVPQRLLRQRWLLALNFALPMAVMTILIMASLNLFTEQFTMTRFSAEIIALVFVLLSYIRWRNVFISLAVGIGSLNGLLILLQ
ncbi:AzlD domain-containing protein [Wohlfahrtiimonas larvae]|uniref:Branched-chain amino acid ABC transporter n=1 Tax=Wohlfahrtiimonas larvae TaxID=1157986 RepID=A0ABP9MIM2_9GAMM|nr:AzlD domain-containing protein [Wohlfahrtiimonas larvae]